MTENWVADVRKYVPNADEKAIAGNRAVLRYRSAEEGFVSLVAFTDKEEVARVRDHFLKKKLGLTAPIRNSTRRSWQSAKG